MLTKYNYMWVNLTSMSLAIFVLAFNTSSLVNALPVICVQYGMEVSSLQWIMNIYMITAAAFILIGGRFCDIFNRKKMFIFFSLIYSLSSLIIALTDSPSVLFTGRLVQGICAAFITSGSLAFVKLTFDPRRLSLAFGLWSGLIGLGCAIGPFLGGVLTDIISWKAIFWLNFIVMGIVIYLSRKYLPQPLRNLNKKVSIDIRGFILFSLSIFSIAYGLIRMSDSGIFSLMNIFYIVAGVILFYIFVIMEKKTKDPLIHFELLKNKHFLCGIMMLFVIMVSDMGIPYFLNIYMQNKIIFDYSPGSSGVMILPFTAAIFIFSFAAHPLLKVIGNRRLTILLSLTAIVIGELILSFGCCTLSLKIIVTALIITGSGIGLCFPLSNTLSMSSIRNDNVGEASGIVNTLSYIAELSGIVVCNLCFFGAGHLKLSLNSKLLKPEHMSYDIMDKMLLGKGQEVLEIIKCYPYTHKEIFLLAKNSVVISMSVTILFLVTITVVATFLTKYLLKNPMTQASNIR